MATMRSATAKRSSSPMALKALPVAKPVIKLNPPPKVISKQSAPLLSPSALVGLGKVTKPSIPTPFSPIRPIVPIGKLAPISKPVPEPVAEAPAASPPSVAPAEQPERYVQYVQSASPQEESDEREEERTDGREAIEEAEAAKEAQEESDTTETHVEAGASNPDEHEPSGFCGEFPIISSHVHNGVMHTASLVFSPHGCSTDVTRVHCPGSDQSGLVNFGGDNPDWLSHAIDRTKLAILAKGATDGPKKEIGAIVRRARTGDQNAMGLIAMVRTRAQAGDEKAIRSAALMRDYIRDNPATSDVGSELDKPKVNNEKLRTVLVLANGLPLGNSKIREFQSQFGEEKHQKVFLYGVIRYREGDAVDLEKQLDEYSKSILEVGRTIGKARSIQEVRLPGSNIAKFDPVIGWELGQ